MVYALDAKGKETVLHSFNAGTADGCDPFGTPAIDATADLYGTTLNCGSANGYGTVWKVTQKKKESLLHSFGGGASDGSYPEAAVVLDPNGNLYGDTLEGGSSNLGTVFELTKAGILTLLHSFSYTKDGAHPIGGVILDANGDLYGTSVEGGSGSYGTVWMLAP